MKTFHGYPLIVVALAGALLVATGCKKQEEPRGAAAVQEHATAVEAAAEPPRPAEKQLPKLLDLGAHTCIPCKMMAPILEELTKEYEGRMEVEFVDVWENEAAGREYGIQQIPTQIFFGSDGRELFRHVGFISKEDILAKWAELGYTFPEKDKE